MNLIGTIVNEYKFLNVIGAGSFGTVYKVEKSNNIYAAKVFSDSFFLSEYKNERNRITNEIDALRKVNSKYLVKYYDDFNLTLESGTMTHVIIMEFVTRNKSN